MMVSNGNLLFQGFIFRFHVSFPVYLKFLVTLGPLHWNPSTIYKDQVYYISSDQCWWWHRAWGWQRWTGAAPETGWFQCGLLDVYILQGGPETKTSYKWSEISPIHFQVGEVFLLYSILVNSDSDCPVVFPLEIYLPGKPSALFLRQ